MVIWVRHVVISTVSWVCWGLALWLEEDDICLPLVAAASAISSQASQKSLNELLDVNWLVHWLTNSEELSLLEEGCWNDGPGDIIIFSSSTNEGDYWINNCVRERERWWVIKKKRLAWIRDCGWWFGDRVINSSITNQEDHWFDNYFRGKVR